MQAPAEDALTPQEEQVLAGVQRGDSDEAIALRLELRESEVRSLVVGMVDRWHLASRAQLLFVRYEREPAPVAAHARRRAGLSLAVVAGGLAAVLGALAGGIEGAAYGLLLAAGVFLVGSLTALSPDAYLPFHANPVEWYTRRKMEEAAGVEGDERRRAGYVFAAAAALDAAAGLALLLARRHLT